MADEPDDLVTEFLTYLEKASPQCKTIKDMIKAEVASALKERPSPSAPGSGNYLEEQNKMLLAQLLKTPKPEQSIPVPLEDGPPPVVQTSSEPLLPEKPPAEKVPFWKAKTTAVFK